MDITDVPAGDLV